MNLVPNSITITNLVTLLCRILSCDNRYDYPVSEADIEAANSARAKSLDHQNDLTAPIVPQSGAPEVTTNLGRIKGYYMYTVKGAPISAFEGIPYAESERFMDPEPIQPWQGILQATKPGPICLQLHYGRLKGQEEGCLNLNVYTKNVNPVKPYPVIIFFHGGTWLAGAGSQYGPAYLLENDVLLVTFNYRLGVLGFFTTGDEEALGNFGMKDQALVIQWVSDHIASFGGDPKRITLVGSSAGAVSTHFQMISNLETIKNKISSAISMSGTAFNIWGLNQLNKSLLVSGHMANVSGCPMSLGNKAVVECLRKVEGDVLVANQLLTLEAGSIFLPSIQPDIPGAFLTRTPDEAYRQGKVAKIPWIATSTSREVNLPVAGFQSQIIVSILRAALLTEFSGLFTLPRSSRINEEEMRSKLIRFYTGGSDSINDLGQEELSRIATDRYFNIPVKKAIQMHSQIAPAYASVFHYSSELGRAGRLGYLNHADFGILHGDDLVYFLNSTNHHPPVRRYDSHFAITKLLVNLYGNFARFGEPLYIAEDRTKYRIWDAVESPDKVRYLRIDEEVKMIDDPFKNISTFWEGLDIPDLKPYFKI